MVQMLLTREPMAMATIKSSSTSLNYNPISFHPPKSLINGGGHSSIQLLHRPPLAMIKLTSLSFFSSVHYRKTHKKDFLSRPKPVITAIRVAATTLDELLVKSEVRIQRAWDDWRKIGAPRLIVAPMVDMSELPFRMLCRNYGAQAAYTPMLHARIFTECEKYRNLEFTTCKEDRPLFVQFCANDPDILLQAAQKVQPFCDYVDINLGCPQRIARRGNYGAFLMDDLPLVKSLVEKLSQNLDVPVSCKIRVFPDLEDTLSYAKMLEDAGCSLLAVHGRKRDEKDGRKIRADWSYIKAVKDALRIPVLANGNIRHMEDVETCLKETGADGVLSTDSLLVNPALFAGYRTAEWAVEELSRHVVGKVDQADLLVEYLKLCEQYPVPWRMVRGHVHKMMGEWFRIHPQVRQDFNEEHAVTFEFLYKMVDQLRDLDAKVPLYMAAKPND